MNVWKWMRQPLVAFGDSSTAADMRGNPNAVADALTSSKNSLKT
jgi:hypothetical protein